MGATDSPPVPAAVPVPRLAEGTELIGRHRGSGFIEPRYLARRGDGQVVQLSELVYLLARLVDGRRDLDELAVAFGAEIDRTVTGEQVAFLLDNKLRPPGLVAPAEGPVTPAELGPAGSPVEAAPSPVRAPTRADPLLMLRYRARLIPERVVWAIAGVFGPLFCVPVVAVLLAGFVGVDVLIVAGGGLGQLPAVAAALGDQPATTLLVLVLILLAGVLHECGHAAACRYGGARPGVMGVGLYLVWPAFYSTVTDAYRLNRAGRLRVDLGGVYFNVISMATLGAAYLVTGSPWLLATLVLLHIETMWQFLPSVRLDGYYILADLVGVPDLFSRLGPILRSAPPWRAIHPRVAELRPWTRRIITLWVALTIPCLSYWVVMFVLLAPRILPVAWAAVLGRVEAIATAVQAAQIAAAALGVVQLLFVVLPYAGLTLIIVNLGRRLCYAASTRHARRSAPARDRHGAPA